MAATTHIEQVVAKLVPFNMDGLAGPLAPIAESGGLVFKYTPSISEAISVDYQTAGDVAHSNEQYHVWSGTKNREISIDNIVFTAENEESARYMLAVIHFFRVMSLMDFGRGKTGRAPPPMWFSAYGGLVYDRVPCLLRGASLSLSESVDYVPLNLSSQRSIDAQRSARSLGAPDQPFSGVGARLAGSLGAFGEGLKQTLGAVPGLMNAQNSRGSSSDTVYLPTKLTVASVSLIVQHSPGWWKKSFDLKDFYSGGMVEGRETTAAPGSSSSFAPLQPIADTSRPLASLQTVSSSQVGQGLQPAAVASSSTYPGRSARERNLSAIREAGAGLSGGDALQAMIDAARRRANNQ